MGFSPGGNQAQDLRMRAWFYDNKTSTLWELADSMLITRLNLSINQSSFVLKASKIIFNGYITKQ